jgi:3-deoxy-D-arabino-heptulosonate 7-phosphate (DAHP) synthase
VASREVSVRLKVDVEEFVVKLKAAKAVLADRERELLAVKGPCSTQACRLHYAHSGPCDIREVAE